MENFNKNIIKIIEESSFYPSGDNCQPFKFKIDEIKSVLSIYHDPKIAKHSLNFKNIASLISFGTLLENISVCAKHYGLDIEENLNITQTETGLTKWGEIKFTEANDATSSPLYPSIKKRVTDRRTFKKTKISQTEIIPIHSFSEINSYIISTKDKQIKNVCAKSDSLLWKWEEAAYDILNWIRFSIEKAVQVKDGFSWKNLGVDFPTSRLLYLMTKNRLFYKFMVFTGFSFIVKIITKFKISSASSFQLITVKDYNNTTLVNAGKLMQRSWLNLTSHGLSAQPIMSLTLTTYTKQRYCNHRYPDFIEKSILSGKKVFKPYFDKGEIPLVMLRIGKCSEFPSEMKTFRKNSPDIIIKLEKNKEKHEVYLQPAV